MGKKSQPSPWLHSADFISPASYFSDAEVEVDSFDSLTKVISQIQDNHAGQLLWRGQENHHWGLHSLLFRKLAEKSGIDLTKQPPVASQNANRQSFPDEQTLTSAEKTILEIARREWRFDSQSALEILARIQHHGGPTRLLDFSFNPYIASWFATSTAKSDDDGRLFALATHGPNPESTEPQIMLDKTWGGYDLPWHDWDTKESQNEENWGNGSLRRFWVPPVYDNRMLAQNAVFVLDGVPSSGMNIQSSFRRKIPGKSNVNWKIADLVSSGSIYLKMVHPDSKNKSTTRNLASSYTVKISRGGKEEIRKRLEKQFGYTNSSIYPDIEGLCHELHSRLLGT